MSEIALNTLRKVYGSVVAVNDISFDIASGEFLTLLGPSGCGKTTTMRMIAGLETPDGGTIRIGDAVVHGGGRTVPAHKRRLGMVFQSYAIWPHMTVFDNVAFPLERLGITGSDQRRRVNDMLAKVELGGLGDRYPSQLSGGQQQRVALARALVAAPEVILFDEPLSNLDAQLRDTMRDLLRDLHQQFGLTAVYVTHDQTEAMALSDRIYIMQNGNLVQGGRPDELYNRPRNLFVAQFIGNTNTIDVAEIDPARAVIRTPGGVEIRAAEMASPVVENKLVIRPHRIRLVSDSVTDNVLAGRIRTVTLLGDRVRYAIEGESGLEIIVDEDTGGTRAAAGDTVRVQLPAEACVVI